MRLRMETLLSKRRAAAARGIPDATDTAVHSEWSAVEEGFRLLERDLGKLQVEVLHGLDFHFHSSGKSVLRRN